MRKPELVCLRDNDKAKRGEVMKSNGKRQLLEEK